MTGKENPCTFHQCYQLGSAPAYHSDTLRRVRDELGMVLARVPEMNSFIVGQSPVLGDKYDNESRAKRYEELRAECKTVRTSWREVFNRVFVDPGEPGDRNQADFVAGTFNLMDELLFRDMRAERMKLEDFCSKLESHVRFTLRHYTRKNPNVPYRTLYPYPDLGPIRRRKRFISCPEMNPEAGPVRRRRKRRRVDYYY